MGGVFGQHAARVAGCGLLPRLASGGQFLRRNGQRQLPFLGVNADGVAILHERNRPAHISLRRDVSDHEAVAAAAEPSVGDERHVFAEALAHDGGSRRKHFPHAGSALRPFVANDDDVAFLDRAVENGFHRLLLGFKHDGLAFEVQPFLAGNFCDRAVAGEVAAQDDQMAVLLDRIIEAVNDGLRGRIRFHVGQRLCHGFAGDGEGVAVEKALVEQHFHQRPDAANGDDFAHQMFSARLQIRENGHVFADAREIVNGQLHLRGVRDGKQVQHGVRGTAQRDDHGDGVLKGFLGEDVERLDANLQHFHDARAGAAAIVQLRG